MRVYISGAITGRPEAEYKAQFRKAEELLWAQGDEVINPARLDYICPDTFDHDDYMSICLELLAKCDAIYLLEGWENSAGAKQELEFAIRCKYAIMGAVRETKGE